MEGRIVVVFLISSKPEYRINVIVTTTRQMCWQDLIKCIPFYILKVVIKEINSNLKKFTGIWTSGYNSVPNIESLQGFFIAKRHEKTTYDNV